MAKRKGGSRDTLVYRRFVSDAKGIRFTVEEFPAVHPRGLVAGRRQALRQ
jgi:hypothetical protein